MFVTKKYTVSSLISEVEALTNSQVANYSSLVSSLSPRAGSGSAKIAALSRYVGGNVGRVLQNTTLGKTPRARLLRALRLRRSSSR
jgi:hypothetical protein